MFIILPFITEVNFIIEKSSRDFHHTNDFPNNSPSPLDMSVVLCRSPFRIWCLKLHHTLSPGVGRKLEVVLLFEYPRDESSAQVVVAAFEVFGALFGSSQRDQEVRLKSFRVTILHMPTWVKVRGGSKKCGVVRLRKKSVD